MPPPDRQLEQAGESKQAAQASLRPYGEGTHSTAASALLVTPNHTCSNPCFNLLCWCNTRAARAVLGAPSFLLLMTGHMQKAQLFTHQGDREGLCLGIGSQLPAFLCQPLKHFAACKQSYGDLLPHFFFSFFKISILITASEETSRGGWLSGH